ncbi:MAG TPA: response regulator transcription factor [Solirubrobacterales bacterium]|nr:response regulator transcription factor [Solirubrobacterales bacterium]
MGADRCCMIIDSHPVVRLGIKRLLEPSWEFEELPDGRGAVDLLNSVGNFEVAIIEMRAAGNNSPSGTATIRSLLDRQPGLGIVAHGGRAERHAIGEALDAGASAYVSKRSSPSTMRSAVDEVLRFNSFIDPDVESSDRDRPRVTPRQRQILQMFADGHSTDEAARRLGLSAETVRTHAKATLPRLGARDRAHAIAIALRSSLID